MCTLVSPTSQRVPICHLLSLRQLSLRFQGRTCGAPSAPTSAVTGDAELLVCAAAYSSETRLDQHPPETSTTRTPSTAGESRTVSGGNQRCTCVVRGEVRSRTTGGKSGVSRNLSGATTWHCCAIGYAATCQNPSDWTLIGSRLRRRPDRLRARADQRVPDLAGHLPAPDPHGGQPCPRLPADLDPVVPRSRNKLDGRVLGVCICGWADRPSHVPERGGIHRHRAVARRRANRSHQESRGSTPCLKRPCKQLVAGPRRCRRPILGARQGVGACPLGLWNCLKQPGQQGHGRARRRLGAPRATPASAPATPSSPR